MSILLRRISEVEKENYNLYCTIEQCNGRIEELESENKRLREASESIKEMSSYLSAGEITIYDLIDIHNICCDALKGENK